MPLPEPILDDLRFQRDLVDEARRRIIRYCPEWTDYNLSDPGITLIELFAWMTELITYRLNLVPEKNYIRFLDILGVQLQPPSSARTTLTFWLSTPFPIRPGDQTVAIVPKGIEVATQRLEDEAEVIFTTDEKLTVRPPVLTQIRRDSEVNKNYLESLNKGIEFLPAFNRDRPQEGDTFYLGFSDDEDISGQILRLSFKSEESQGTGIVPEDPPLVWEVSVGSGKWEVIRPSTRLGEEDTTGGFNYPQGRLTLYLPLGLQPDEIHGKRAYWIRCRFEPKRPEQGKYTQTPRILSVNAQTVGGSVLATHAVVEEDIELGESDGEPGQCFKLHQAPVLAPTPEERVEVEEIRDGELVFIPWEQVPDFSNSKPYDRHYTLDTASGEICFGPSIRQRDGTVRQYGRIPEADRNIRFSRYRYGGGAIGNIPAGKLQVLRTSLPYIDRVTNIYRAEGGRDQESLEEAKLRARREIRAQQRAVTTEDFENLTKQGSREVARVKCQTPSQVNGSLPPGMMELLIVPAAFDSVALKEYSKLRLLPPLLQEIRTHIDKYRLLTTTLKIREARYIGVKIKVDVVPSDFSVPEVVQERVLAVLNRYISPLAIPPENEEMDILKSIVGPNWEGWPFGKDIYVSEIFSLVQQVRGVKHVMEVHINYRDIVPEREALYAEALAEGDVDIEIPELVTTSERMLAIPEDTIVCSLSHEVDMVYL